jgi:hypothetical protein
MGSGQPLLRHRASEVMTCDIIPIRYQAYTDDYADIEVDDCFYLQDVEAVTGKDRLNLSSDPPPDLAIKVDLTLESARKLSLYAALGVTEVWQYSDNGIVFWHLDESRTYRAAPNSLVVPFLTSEKIAEFISGAESSRSYEARRDFRVWVRSNQPKSC